MCNLRIWSFFSHFACSWHQRSNAHNIPFSQSDVWFFPSIASMAIKGENNLTMSMIPRCPLNIFLPTYLRRHDWPTFDCTAAVRVANYFHSQFVVVVVVVVVLQLCHRHRCSPNANKLCSNCLPMAIAHLVKQFWVYIATSTACTINIVYYGHRRSIAFDPNDTYENSRTSRTLWLYIMANGTCVACHRQCNFIVMFRFYLFDSICGL